MPLKQSVWVSFQSTVNHTRFETYLNDGSFVRRQSAVTQINHFNDPFCVALRHDDVLQQHFISLISILFTQVLIYSFNKGVENRVLHVESSD